MHEISLVRNIFNTLHSEFDTGQIRKIIKINITAGILSNIEPQLLQNAFDAVVATDSPEFADAILAVNILPVIIHCNQCDKSIEIKNYIFKCTTCGTPSNNIIQGNELLISGVEMK